MPSVLSSLNGALHRTMADERVVLLGEDLLDPYGGAFKVSKGLSTAFPERVFTTPISEAGFTGVAAGMAMRGLLPVVEIMFGDFLLLAGDQIVNHIAKYPWMYNGQVDVPIVIRTPMGGRRGYGPTHSQSLEKHFLGVPGLVVLAPHPHHDPGALLEHAILHERRPVLFIENKLLYGRAVETPIAGRVGEMYARTSEGPYPTTTLSFDDSFSHADLTVVAQGGMSSLALRVAEELLLEEEIYAEVVLPTLLSPLDLEPIARSLRRSGRLLVTEEATPAAGWSSEVIARVCKAEFGALRAAPAAVSSRDCPIANTRTLEEAILPQEGDILRAALELVRPAPVRLARGGG